MSRRSHKAVQHKPQYNTEAREALERRWASRLDYDHSLAWMVTGERNHLEPFHRWLHFKQSFAPELVRRFLKAANERTLSHGEAPFLDPFGGAGTFVIECARKNVAAIAIETMPSLVFLANARMQDAYTEVEEIPDWESWRSPAEKLSHPLHRAALMLAVGQQHQSDGTPLAKPPTLRQLFDSVCRMMREDLVHPLAIKNPTQLGDARFLDTVESDSITGIMTSPPYLSRHDYERVLRPYERVLSFWNEPSQSEARSAAQIPAHHQARKVSAVPITLHASVIEVFEHLGILDHVNLGQVVTSYFQEMGAVLSECRRVLAGGGQFWMVVGGARLKDVYVPSDLILAEMAEREGMEVRKIEVARRLVDTGRKLGQLMNVAPRESILQMTKK